MNDSDSIADSSMLKLPFQVLYALVLLSLWSVVPTAPLALQTVEAHPSAQVRVAPVVKPASANSAAKPFSPSIEVREAAVSILQLVPNLSPGPNNNNFVVNVPSYNFAGILQELQNRHAKFVLPGTQIPPTAKAVFTLQAEESGLSQVVYLTEQESDKR